jgi:hypothetical protein
MKERMRSGGASKESKISTRTPAQTHIWRLPSGKPLAEFALEAGFLAPSLVAAGATGRRPESAGKKADRP